MPDKYIIQRRTASGLENVAELPALENGKINLSWLPVVGAMGSAIIERGSNANGEYVRWADGTQICRSTIERTGLDVLENWQIWETNSYTPPAAFAGTYDVLVTSVDAQNSDGENLYADIAFRNSNFYYIWNTGTRPANFLPGVGIRVTSTDHYSVTSATIRVVAVGRWK